MKKENKLKKRIGELFIILSLLLALFIYYPVITAYILPASDPKIDNNAFSINIPKIKLKSEIIKNVDPFNEKEYLSTLKKGIAHAKNTSLPGEKGTIFLFGHSSDYPWNLTRYNTIFLKLGDLNRGDEIILRRNGKEYKFKVFDKKTVWPSEIKYLKEIDKNQLILQTCTPIGTALRRLLIFAKPI